MNLTFIIAAYVVLYRFFQPWPSHLSLRSLSSHELLS